MSVLPPLRRDSPMSIEHIAPANQFHYQIPIVPSKSPTMTAAQSPLTAVVMAMATSKSAHLMTDTLCPVCILSSWLLVCLSFISGTRSHVFKWANRQSCVYTYGTSAQVHQVRGLGPDYNHTHLLGITMQTNQLSTNTMTTPQPTLNPQPCEDPLSFELLNLL